MPNEIPSEIQVTKIRPAKGWAPLNLKELWKYRELIYFFTWRDLKVKYKQTILGISWAIIQPFFTMIIFSLFFGRLAKIPSDDIPYPIFSYSGLVIWTYFANGVTFSSHSMVDAANTIKKVYFPRLTIPIGTIFSGLVDFTLAFTILLIMMAVYGIAPTWNVVWLPLLLMLALITALGTGLWLSAMNVLFRDVKYAIPFIVQAWLFATPIAYPSNLLSGPWRVLYGLNPMAGVVDGFRWALLGTDTGPDLMMAVSVGVSVILFVSGAYFFRRMEKNFADVI